MRKADAARHRRPAATDGRSGDRKLSLDETQARLTIFDVPDKPGIAAEIFDAVAPKASSST